MKEWRNKSCIYCQNTEPLRGPIRGRGVILISFL